MQAAIFEQCQKLFPAWADSSMVDFTFDDPKGFSSFTMGIRSKKPEDSLYPVRAPTICQISTGIQAKI